MATETTQPNTNKTNWIGTIAVYSANPDNAETGTIYYNSTTNHLTYYNGTTWVGAPFTRE